MFTEAAKQGARMVYVSGEAGNENQSERPFNNAGRSRGSGSQRRQSDGKQPGSPGAKNSSSGQRKPRPKPSGSSGSGQQSGQGSRTPNRRRADSQESPPRRDRSGGQRGRPPGADASGSRGGDTAGRRSRGEGAGSSSAGAKTGRSGGTQPADRARDADGGERRGPRGQPKQDRSKDARKAPEKKRANASERSGRGSTRPGDASERGEKRAGQQPPARGPQIADDIDVTELDAAARRELRSLPRHLADRVTGHLVMANRLAPEDPDAAYQHAAFARSLASRVPIVREACGLAAYHSGRWSDALTELRAARRMSGHEDLLPVLADCERGLGRPQRALELIRSSTPSKLAPATRVELWIVESGARRDLGEYEAAVVALQGPQLNAQRVRPWTARLLYAYADALVDAGRPDEARDWFSRALSADTEDQTDAGERLAELDGLEFLDAVEDEDEGAAGTE